MRICVIFNPAARGEKAAKLQHILHAFARDCTCKPTSFAGEAQLLAAQAVRDGFDTIIAAGGDGTLNEVLNGFGDVPDGFGQARLGILPLGTINVFARELKIPLKLEKAWELISQNRETLIDLPQAEFISGGKTVTRYFAQLAGAGLDAKAVALVDWNWKTKVGPLAYVTAGFRALQSKQSEISVVTPTGSAQGELVLIGNGKLYGGNFTIFPHADLQDGEFDICVVPKVNLRVLLQVGAGYLTGNFHRFSGAKLLRASSATLSSDEKTFFQLDGEDAGELPARLSLHPKKIRVLTP
ncbi:MAG: diacylglycerol kinase family protein [Verrucomicrobiota bacterium]